MRLSFERQIRMRTNKIGSAINSLLYCGLLIVDDNFSLYA